MRAAVVDGVDAVLVLKDRQGVAVDLHRQLALPGEIGQVGSENKAGFMICHLHSPLMPAHRRCAIVQQRRVMRNQKYLGIYLIKFILYNIHMDQFVALADPTRRQIIEMLADRGELSASDISSCFAMSAPAISQHLKALRDTNLVTMEKRGQQRIYRLNPDAMLELEVWIDRLKRRWNERFTALDAVLEELKRGENHEQQHSNQE